MITIFSRYIVQCPKGVGRNSYQGHVNDSGEFWGVPHQVSMKTRYSGHLYSSLIAKWTWVDHRDQFSLYKESEKMTLSPVQIHCILPRLQSVMLYSISSTLLITFNKGEHPCLHAVPCAAQHYVHLASIEVL
jgi:hypothetical protein